MTPADRIADLLAEWQERQEQSPDADRGAFLAEHPAEADELRRHLELMPVLELAFAPRLRLPDAMGPYRLGPAIGSGGMGTVYRAEAGPDCRAVPPGTVVALKVPHAHLLGRAEFVDRFVREGEVGRRVRHENVIPTLDAGTVTVGIRRVPYLVTELCEGKTLRALLRELREVPEALLREVARQVAIGLSAIHAAGIVHRDLKPENLVLTADHRVRIMDLGVARPVHPSELLTQSGQFAGTLQYAAPEQFRGVLGPPADLYGLGVTLYELATGSNPFRRDEPAAVMAAHLEITPRPLSEVRPDSSAFFSEVVATLLRKRSEERFPSADVLAAVLEQGEEHPWWALREGELSRKRFRRPVVPVRRETRLFGREEDLAALRAAWSRARDGRGGMILIEGEAGIGKTRLLDAMLAEIDADDAHLFYGSYPPFGGRGAMAEALIDHFGRTSLEERLSAYLKDRGEVVARFASFVREESLPADTMPLAPDTVHSLGIDLNAALSREAPVLWVVDDLHHAGPESRRLLLTFARAAAQQRVLIVVSTRPDLPETFLAELGRLPSFERRRLCRLSPRQVMELLCDAFRSESLADRLGGRIALKSDGVPFFVFETIRGLREAHFLTQTSDQTWVESRTISEIEVPSAVRDLIEGRIRAFSREERAILDVGAVEGYEFDPDLVARVLGETRVEVLQHLGEMERRSGVVRADGRHYRFDHHQIQEVIYGQLSLPLREEYHTLLAEARTELGRLAGRAPEEIPPLEATVLARHYLFGREPKKALPFLLPAVRQLGDVRQHDQRIELIEAAVARPGLLEDTARARLLVSRASTLGMLGRFADQLPSAEEAVRLAQAADDDELRGQALRALGHALLNVSRWAESEGAFRQAADRHEAAAMAVEAGVDRVFLSYVLRHLGRPAEAEAEIRVALEVARREGDLQLEGRATEALGTLLAQAGRYAESWPCFARRLSISRQSGDRDGERSSLWNMGIQKVYSGEHEEARRYLLESLQISREARFRAGEAACLLMFGISFLRTGEHAAAREHLERCLALRREMGERSNLGSAAGHLGTLHVLLGRLAEAREHFDLELRSVREGADAPGETVALLNSGSLRRLLGEADAARADLEDALRRSQARRLRRLEGIARHELGRLAEAEDDPAKARRCYEEALAVRRAIGAAPGIAATLVRLGALLVNDGDLGAARDAFREALAAGKAGGDPDDLLLASRRLAALGEAVEGDLLAMEARAGVEARMEARFTAFLAGGAAEDLREAKRLLAHLADNAPPGSRESLLTRVALHRRIAEAGGA